jgi:hypothetical protein
MLWPDEITPPLDHEIVQKMAREIKSDAIAERVKRAGRPRPCGNCYWNVAAIVRESGGWSVPGWAIMWWPKLYGMALHHAVWRHPDGRLIDVTEPQPPDKAASYTVFVADNSLDVTLDIPPRIDNKFFILTDHPAVRASIDAYSRKQTLSRQINKIYWDAGYRCADFFAVAVGGKVEPRQLDIHGETRLLFEKLQWQYGAAEKEMGASFQALKRLDLMAIRSFADR